MYIYIYKYIHIYIYISPIFLLGDCMALQGVWRWQLISLKTLYFPWVPWAPGTLLIHITVSYSKDCLPKGLPTRPTRSVPTADPYRPVLNIFQKNRECDFFGELCVGKTNRPPTDPTDQPVP